MSMKIQTFETIMIFKDTLTEEEYLDKVKDMRKWLAGLPAARIKTELMGKKKMAYGVPPSMSREGWYVYFIYQSTEDLINTKLDLMLRKDDDVIKFMTTNFKEDYLPDDYDASPASVNRKKPVDVFDLIFGLEGSEVI